MVWGLMLLLKGGFLTLASLGAWFYTSPFAFLKCVLQIITFTIAFTSLLTFLIKLTHFSYAEALSKSMIVKIFIGLMFLRMKVWDLWFYELIYVNYFCCVIFSLYLYDCCCNIGQYLSQIKNNFRQIFLLGTSFLTIFLLIWLIYLGKINHQLSQTLQNPNKMLGLVVLLIIAVYFVCIYRTRSFVIANLIIILIIYMIISRHKAIKYSQNDYYSGFFSLPWECLPCCLMALDAQAREQKEIMKKKKQPHKQQTLDTFNLLIFAISFFIYSLLNQRIFHFEVPFGLISLSLLILNR